ncbi:MAG: biotin-independent malonate decarboxylase subunit beta [Betaproteobacteria bacterium]|nr:biotin-independent malonate decarboxylase subunit beta [Betaproteobacteria bacterium]
MRGLAQSYREALARLRVQALLDPGSFSEWVGPTQRVTSPHLAALEAPVSFDDGVIVGQGLLHAHPVIMIAQEGQFNGGAVGEVHGAKIRGALLRAVRDKPGAVLLCIDSGGVRLHEANAGLIAISEIMRALFAVQEAGIPVIALIGGACGAFGGMGIVARLCDVIIISEEGRIGLSGPEVIETVKGVEEFDSRDRALVWRITGGKIRRTLGEATLLVDDDIAAFRAAAGEMVGARSLFLKKRGLNPTTSSLQTLQAAQQQLGARAELDAEIRDGQVLWSRMGLGDQVSLMSPEQFNRRLEALES